MQKITKIFLISFIFLTTVLNASENAGSLSISIFKDGKPLQNTQVILDAKDNYVTDADGSLHIFLSVGKHKVEIFGKEGDKNLGYFKRSVEIKRDKDTQITAEFTEDENDEIDIDTPFDTDISINKSTGLAIFSGVLISSDTKKAISNARIFVMGTDVDARSDAEGKFEFEVPSGIKLNISFIHSEHTSKTLKDIVLDKDAKLNKTVSLSPASMELEEFVILAPKVTGSIAMVMAEEKQVNAIVNILGSEQISKKGDSSAASALKRVTGVTLIGGKNIYVRGLGDRYSNIEMNSMPLPSPDPTKRVVPLDIFPAGVISSMKVQKSSTPDIPASFGGGYVDIRTKDKSKDDYMKISFGIKANSNTGKDAPTYEGSDTDIYGFDDGYREIGGGILENSTIVVGERQKSFTTAYFTKEEISAFTQSYVNGRNFNVTNEALPFGGSISVEGAVNYDINDKNKITIFGNYGYVQENQYRLENWYKYEMDKTTNSLYKMPNQYGTTKKSYSDYSHAGIFNIGYNFMDVFRIKYTKLYTHTGTKSTRITDGKLGSNQNDYYTKYYLDWEERTLNTDQISGNFDYAIFDIENNFRFGFENAIAELYQPNNFVYSYLDDGSTENPFLTKQISNHVGTNLESDDELSAFYLKNKFNIEFFSEDDYIDIGFSSSFKERTSKQNKYFLAYRSGAGLTPDTDMTADIETVYNEEVRTDIDYDDRALIIGTLSQPKDYFDAEVDETNFYLSTLLKPTKSIEFLFGGRQVDLTQTIYQYVEDRDNPDFSLRRLVQKVPTVLSINDFYPSASLKYKFNKNNHLDFAYTKTYIMPDLREASDGIYTHPYDVADIMGNPNLVNTDIENFDLKYSHYFSDTENIKTGLFYKDLDKPIEDVMKPSSSLPIYSFDNADNAVLYGIEFDGRKKLSFIYHKLINYFISGNLSYTKSDVTLRKEQESTYTNNHRELQGLSKIVINISLSYERKDRSATLSYNKMGERIRKVGMIDYDGGEGELPSMYPDYMEDPAAVVDFVWIEKLDFGMGLKVKFGNILDKETVWFQGSKDNVTNRFKKGRTFSVSASYRY
ncbi:TonB-dependent receptor plug domain-containing protein [Sulfurimonas lithotrophica]|uniref:TonB-dependent receptor plug domain-containing protein n=1 Tax=Sulfurimonas lithotrophica TaxID=2590022 RepID=A0A5P8P367_9BACT|nr:TonB-dependent receptor [Sulfurimonas lithotrophica]QFR50149.1 TonB-dependent receptor plug domain-containing protein [Sulfurimonas lithotrophica]